MISYLQKIDSFTENLNQQTADALLNISKAAFYKKGDFLLKEGDTCKRSFFIVKGIARKFYLNDGKEITTELLFEDDLAISFHSYLLQKPGREYIQAVSDLEVTTTDYIEFQNLKKQYTELVELDLMLTEFYALWIEERLFQFRTLSATERYLSLLSEQTHLIKYIPLTYIASYLGINPETLSRIRAKI